VRNHYEFPFRERWFVLRRTQIGPQHAAALNQWIGFQFDLPRETAFHGFRRDFDALAGMVEFPAVIGAPQAALFVPAEPQRHAAVSAKLVDQSVAALAVAKSYETFRKQLDPYWWTVIRRELCAKQRGDPVAAKEFAHRQSRASLRNERVIPGPQH